MTIFLKAVKIAMQGEIAVITMQNIGKDAIVLLPTFLH